MAERKDKHTADFTFEGRQYQTRGRTKNEALEKKIRKLAELEAGRAATVRDGNMIFREWANVWLDAYKRRVLPSTKADIKARIDNLICPAIGHIRMKDITRTYLENIISGMDGFSADRIRKAKQTLSQIFAAAVNEGMIAKAPNIKSIELPTSATDGKRRVITPRERELTLQVAKYHQAGAWVLTMLYCGLRPQETAALQGRHIDTKNMELHIEQALKSDGTIGETKTGAGRRAVPFPERLLEHFQKAQPFDFVFKTPKGKPLTKQGMAKMWRAFKHDMQIMAGCKVVQTIVENGERKTVEKKIMPEDMKKSSPYRLVPPYPIAEDLTPYCYRHTYATDAVTNEVRIETLKELMGHANISVTSKFYTHMTPERMRRARELLSAAWVE